MCPESWPVIGHPRATASEAARRIRAQFTRRGLVCNVVRFSNVESNVLASPRYYREHAIRSGLLGHIVAVGGATAWRIVPDRLAVVPQRWCDETIRRARQIA
jgi:hypothetical protein